MTSSRRHRPVAAYVLYALLFFQSASALYGGGALLADPSGALLQMPSFALQQTPFLSYLLPGLILFVLLGVFPAVTLYGLIARPAWRWAGALNIYRNRHWAWTYALYLGIMLIIWMDVQVMMIGYGHGIQALYSAVGLAITVTTLFPSVVDYYTADAS